ncbi:MAG: Spy/CpxP family protein refolding chaperone [Candidatus Sericytochromatia bacterium]
MKITTLLKTTLGGLMALSLMTACGSLDSALTSASLDTSSLQTQSLSGFAAPGGQKGPRGGQGGHKGKSMGVGGNDFADISLSDEQKTALQALREEYKPEQPVALDTSKQAEVKTLIETAFLSSNFDAAALATQVSANVPNHDAQLQKQAELMIKSWQILTSEQKAQVKAKQAEREAQMAEREANRPTQSDIGADKGGPGIERLTSTLNLTSEQQASLKAAFEANKPDFESQKTAMQANRTAIQAELDASSPSVDNLVLLLKANHPEKANQGLNQLAQLHAILTPEQRQSFVDAGLALGHPGKMGPAGRGGHEGGSGGHNGTGFGPGMPGRGMGLSTTSPEVDPSYAI